MSGVRVTPGLTGGRVRAPPSKSYTHRALVLGHLSGKPYRLGHPLDADDTRRTAAALARLGTAVDRHVDRWDLRPARSAGRSRAPIDCGESGTTLRFVVTAAARSDRLVRFTGRGRLGQRPMFPLLAALRELGVTTRTGPRGFLLEVQGPLHGGRVQLDGSASSQFASSLLLTLPTVEGDSRLELVGPLVSAPYLDATLAILREHGVRVRRRARRYEIPGGQVVRSHHFDVPGDASSASYLWAAAALTGTAVRVDGIPARWPQADLAILPLLRRAGAVVVRRGDTVEVRGDRRRPFSVDLTDAPDLYPLAGVLAAVTAGKSRLVGAAHAAGKESDRPVETASLVRALGARALLSPAGLSIEGTSHPRALDRADLTDHRLLMSAGVASLVADGPSHLGPGDAVAKSYPGFWRDLERLGAEVRRP